MTRSKRCSLASFRADVALRRLHVREVLEVEMQADQLTDVRLVFHYEYRLGEMV